MRVDPIYRTEVEDHPCFIVDFNREKTDQELYFDVLKAMQSDTHLLGLPTVLVQGNAPVSDYHRQRIPSWCTLFRAFEGMMDRIKEGGATVSILEDMKVAGMGAITANGSEVCV